jgi:hypothetical protein
MEDDSMRFDEDATVVNLEEELEFDEFHESNAELELLFSRVKAARLAGV